ncbi:MAG: lipocalin family protein [Weeksellaceae bacterium]|nr:lipocalin family protein [Weeksellaceae bacterium]
MKNHFFYLSIVLLTFGLFTSCSSDDDSGSGSFNEQILGKWAYSQAGMVIEGQEVLENWEHLCASKKDHSEFTSNGKVISTEYDSDCTEFDVETLNYSISGDKLTVSEEGGMTQTFTIKTLNSSTLKLTLTEEFEGVEMTLITIFKKM